ncbi:MAG: hypothetical protein R6X15_10100, partial [Pseudomonadota bacterium]
YPYHGLHSTAKLTSERGNFQASQLSDISAFTNETIFANGIIKTINYAVVSLATFELGLGLGIGIGKEYTNENTEPEENIFASVRRSITRFVAVVCIALVLEGLIMVIKYSQLDLAGNLYYPVAIIISAAVLLLSLGGFLKLTNQIECYC